MNGREKERKKVEILYTSKWKNEFECNMMAINLELAPDITITYTLRIKINAEVVCMLCEIFYFFASFHKLITFSNCK